MNSSGRCRRLDVAVQRRDVVRGARVCGGARYLAVDDADAVVEICRRLDGIPLGDRTGRLAPAVDDCREIRDRLDDRFRLLVGSRRGLERHQTLRHAVQWSYDLLDDAEKYAAGKVFGVRGRIRRRGRSCAVARSRDEFATLDLLDALVRKSLLVADRSSGRTRFSMLETIRQFAEEQLVANWRTEEARAAHARYFAGREADVMALWDSPRQRDAYTWFDDRAGKSAHRVPMGCRPRRPRCRRGDRRLCDVPRHLVEQHEPSRWADELIDRAEAGTSGGSPQLYVMAAMCFQTDEPTRPSAMPMPARRPSTADDSTRPIRVRSLSERRYLTTVSPSVPSTCAATCSNSCGPADLDPVMSRLRPYHRRLARRGDRGIRPLLTADDDNPVMESMALMAYGFAHTAADPDARLRGATARPEDRARQRQP